MYTSGDFILHRDDTPFANRQKLLFDELLIAEKGCNKNRAIPVPEDVELNENEWRQQPLRVERRPRSETKKFRGKESIFKRPERPAPRASFKSIPDHHRNPHKWVKYSLDDVSNEDMTDRSNTQAALSFLKELRARKIQEQRSDAQDQMDVDDKESVEPTQTKVPFKQRTVKANSNIRFKKPDTDAETKEQLTVILDHDDKPTFRSSKVVMPEYVVGQKQKKRVKKEKPSGDKINRTKELKLDHLEEPDEEED